MNPNFSAPSHPAMAGPATATALLHLEDTPWPGLAVAAERIGVELDARAVARLHSYRDLLVERSTRVNLTAIRKPIEVERRLFLDALAMLTPIDTFLITANRASVMRPSLIDIGSGAGFPGLVLKIARPDVDVTLVDATAKKVSFMNEIISHLDLDGVRAIHARAEDIGQDAGFRERFLIATARAVASLPVLLELTIPLLDVGGQAYFPKGMAIDDELKTGRKAARTLGSEIISANEIPPDGTRLVVARKNTLTAKRYPRHVGLPRQSPLGGGS